MGVGDEVVTCRNDRRLTTSTHHWARNGDRWTVTARHADGALTVDSLTDRGRIRLPTDYVADEVELAYAVTLHKAQGVTVDRAVVIVDDATTAEALYVGMTRGRASNHALAVTGPAALDDHTPAPAVDPLTLVEAAIARSAA